MLAANTTNAVPLSSQQLNLIYSCTDTTWTSVGGTSTDTIIPIIPQVGSGTRSSFLSAIGNPTLGSCVKVGEENDPTAIGAQATPADAIEPMSGGRLDLFLGLLSNGTSNGVGPYFRDPSCSLNAINTSTPAACAAANNSLSPAVHLITTGTPSDANPLFNISRPLYIYFRDADVSSTTPWQPGGTLNAVRSLFYNPCTNPPTGCTTVGGITYGPGGPPFFAQAGAQAAISAAGIVPTYVPQVAGP
jgi:ABC-type phosphate transport system substrate-binding protein